MVGDLRKGTTSKLPKEPQGSSACALLSLQSVACRGSRAVSTRTDNSVLPGRG